VQAPKKSFKLDTTIIAAIIGAVATILAAVIGGLFLLHSILPSPPNITSTASAQPTAPPGGNTAFTCTSGSVCLSYSMTIQNTAIMIHQDNTSTWSFHITNHEDAITIVV